MKINVLVWVQTQQCCGLKIVSEILYIYSPKKETQHVKNIILLQIFNIILNTEISITLH